MKESARILFGLKAEDDIDSFSETPAKETSVEDLENAEEQVEEEQESSTETSMDYGTPGSVDDPSHVGGNCPSCDAGDAAIIDAEVAPVEEDAGEDTDIGGDIEMVFHWLNQLPLTKDDTIPSSESIGDILESLIGALKLLTIKVVKYTTKIYRFSRNRISATYLRLQTVHGLWNKKLANHLSDVDMDRLSELEIEAFPYDTWIEAAKVSLAAFEMVAAAERIVFEPGDEAVTNSMDHFASKLQQVGIKINVPKNRLNVDELLDNRKYESITSLGYSKSQIPNCLRYFGDIAKRVPKGDLNTLEPVTKKVIDRITQFASSINTAVEENRLKKGGPEYRAEVDKLLNYTVRFDFILNCMKCSYFLFDRLTADMLHVFEKYETAMTDPEYI